MPAEKKPRFTLGTVDDLFTTQEMRDEAKLKKLHEIPPCLKAHMCLPGLI